jgi:glutaredoxin
METIIWSKPMCPYCDKAKALLNLKGIEFEERKLGSEWTKEQLLESVPTARSVPQIFLRGEYIGGYTELEKYFEDHNMEAGENM